ncbi:MAG: hypothetical protein M1150_02770 [Patescibacteria group bacterium]|nr:hypothetical protein [Patescibacteria group bacterium]
MMVLVEVQLPRLPIPSGALKLLSGLTIEAEELSGERRDDFVSLGLKSSLGYAISLEAVVAALRSMGKDEACPLEFNYFRNLLREDQKKPVWRKRRIVLARSEVKYV